MPKVSIPQFQHVKEFLKGKVNTVLIVLSFLLWCYLFRGFLFGEFMFISDARPYYEHIQYFVESLLQGVYPLWDPMRSSGVPNEFFLRRIGEFNPFYLLCLFFVKLGFTFNIAYRLFLFIYFFIGMLGFYGVSKKLFKDSNFAILSFLILIFSSIGTHLFYDFLILIFTPTVWFFFFLISFCQKPGKFSLCGITLTFMILLTTYIPFYFLVGLFLFIFFYCIFFCKEIKPIIKRCKKFANLNKILVILCILAIGISSIPGYLIYDQGSSGEILLPRRHGDMQEKNAFVVDDDIYSDPGSAATVRVSMMFSDLTNFHLGYFFIPLFAFLLFLLGSFFELNKKLGLLILWSFSIFIISSPEATALNTFLREKAFVFKFFRNLHLFLELFILPAFVLIIVEQAKVCLNKKINPQKKSILAIGLIILIHLGFMILLIKERSFIVSNFAVLILSLLFFIAYWMGRINLNKPMIMWGVFILIVIQPVQVFSILHKNFRSEQGANKSESSPYLDIDFKYIDLSSRLQKNRDGENAKGSSIELYKPQMYVTTNHLYRLYSNIDYEIYQDYARNKFVIYDEIVGISDIETDFKKVENAFKDKKNRAFVAFSQGDNVPERAPQQDKNRVHNKSFKNEVETLHLDANSITVKTSFNAPKFLVYNDTYFRGWRAYINERPVDLYRANIAFKGLWVPSGENTVQFIFEQKNRIILGFLLMAICCALLGATFYFSRIELYKSARKGS